MAGEEAARRTIEQALRRPVVLYDNGSRASMVDLVIGDADAPDVAVEVVAAVDPVFTETWNHGPARGPLRLDIRGDWTVIIDPTARLQRFRQQIEPLLQQLEARGLFHLRPDHFFSQDDDRLLDDLEALGIQHAWCYRVEGTGLVHMSLPGAGGAVDGAGSAIPEWIAAFLRDPRRADVLSKLDKSRAGEHHVFVPVTFAGAPWEIESYLTGDLEALPATAPDLPPEVTGVWIIHTFSFSRRGVRWDHNGWHFFNAPNESH